MPFFAPHCTPSGGLHAAATERNREPILEVLRGVLPPTGLVLEIASGTGQHVVFLAHALPALRWQPSDPSSAHLDSIRAWMTASSADNVAPPLALDVERQPWPNHRRRCDSEHQHDPHRPVVGDRGAFSGRGALLSPSGVLFLYGPFKRDGQHTAESNQRFDERLRAEDPRWGVRDLGRGRGPSWPTLSKASRTWCSPGAWHGGSISTIWRKPLSCGYTVAARLARLLRSTTVRRKHELDEIGIRMRNIPRRLRR